MSDTTQTSTLMPGASAAPPLTIDPALVSLAQAAQAPVAPIPVIAIGAQPAPVAIPSVTPPDALTVLANQAAAHVHGAPRIRAAQVLATVQAALDAAVGLHTTGVAMATKAAASSNAPGTASGLVADAEAALTSVEAKVGTLETEAVAGVKKVTGIVMPTWAVGLAMLIVGAAASAIVMRWLEHAALKL